MQFFKNFFIFYFLRSYILIAKNYKRGIYMLTALTIESVKTGKWYKKVFNKLRGNSIITEIKKRSGSSPARYKVYKPKRRCGLVRARQRDRRAEEPYPL